MIAGDYDPGFMVDHFVKDLGIALTEARRMQLALHDVEMQINQAPMSVSLLGMDFFRRLESYRVENGRLYMRWRE